MMTKNVAVKIIPVGKESAIADIQDSEIIKATGHRALSNTYTYYKYADASNIPIFYRKRFPYETFIDTQSVGEVISTLFRHSNFALLINASLLIYFIKKFIDTWGIPFVRKK